MLVSCHSKELWSLDNVKLVNYWLISRMTELRKNKSEERFSRPIEWNVYRIRKTAMMTLLLILLDILHKFAKKKYVVTLFRNVIKNKELEKNDSRYQAMLEFRLSSTTSDTKA